MTQWDAPPQPVGEARWRFPHLTEMPEGDLVTLGGDVEPSTLIEAYRRGIFPMEVTEVPGVLAWWSPDPRGILPLERLRVTRSMRQSAKRYEVRVDTCFERVIRGCADPSRDKAWISDDIIAGYTRLHDLGWAHSIEVFDRQGGLVGGLYGVRVGGLFAGESMFHVSRDASKVALMALVDLMRTSGMGLLDVQWQSDHLESLGAVAVPRVEYFARLADALAVGHRPSQASRIAGSPI
jgi:leucyl/phenylalanyl-tRNA---protein transferase